MGNTREQTKTNRSHSKSGDGVGATTGPATGAAASKPGVKPSNDAKNAGSSPGCTALMYACQQGDVDQVARLVRQNPNLARERDRTQKIALHYCAEARTARCADLVLSAARDLVDATDVDGLTALHLAAIAGNVALVNFLLANGANPRAMDLERHTVVHWATVCGEAGALRAVLAAGAPASTPDVHGGYPLHYAAQMCGDHRAPSANTDSGADNASRDTRRLGLEVLETLLNAGSRTDVVDGAGRQPLLWAASAGAASAVMALVAAGARADAADTDGLTALHCAASRGHTDCLEALLLMCGVQPDLIDSNGCTALHYAVTLGHADATALLLAHGADVNRRDRRGRTPAHCGAAKGQVETVRLVAAHGGELWARDARGDLPLHEAAVAGRRQLVRWLLARRPAQVDAANSDGRTALHIASLRDNADMCKILLDHGANPNCVMRTSKNVLMTPLDCALRRSFRSTAKFLQLSGGVPYARLRAQPLPETAPVLSSGRTSRARAAVPESDDSDAVDAWARKQRKRAYRHKRKLKLDKETDRRLRRADSDSSLSVPSPSCLYSHRVQTTSAQVQTDERFVAVPIINPNNIQQQDNILLDVEQNLPPNVDKSKDDSKEKIEKEKLDDEIQKNGEEKSKEIEEGLKQEDDNVALVDNVKDSETVIEAMVHAEQEEKQLKREENVEEISSVEKKSSSEEKKSSSEDKKSSLEEKCAEAVLDESSTVNKEIVEEKENEPLKEKLVSFEKEEKAFQVIETTGVEENKEMDLEKEIKEKVIDIDVSNEKEIVNNKISEEKNITDTIEEKESDNLKATDELDNKENEVDKNKTKDSLDALSENQKSVVFEEIDTGKQESSETQEKNTEENTSIDISEVKKTINESIEDNIGVDVKLIDNNEVKSVVVLDEKYLGDKVENTFDETDVNDDVYEDKAILKIVTLKENETLNEDSSFEKSEQNDDSQINCEDKQGFQSFTIISDNEEGLKSVKKSVLEDGSNIVDKRIKNNNNKTYSGVKGITNKTPAGQNKIVKTNRKNLNDLKNNNKSIVEKEYKINQGRTLPEKGTVKKTSLPKLTSREKTSVDSLSTEDMRSKSVQENYTRTSSDDDSSKDQSEQFQSFIKIPRTRKSASAGREKYSDDSDSADERVSTARKRRIKSRSKSATKESYGSDSQLMDSGFEPSPRSSRIPRHKCVNNKPEINMTSVTQSIQTNIRRYHLERKIFQHLLELKRLQIRTGQANEAVLVKRAIDNYHRSCLTTVGAGRYTEKELSFKSFEKFLYDSLRKLQKGKVKYLEKLPETVSPLQCTHSTLKCPHATHAYTGVPCAAYVTKINHHTIPKVGFGKKQGFLPKLPSENKEKDVVTLELIHGEDRQFVTLPADKLDQNKKYFVTFTVKGQPDSDNDVNKHRHAKSC